MLCKSDEKVGSDTIGWADIDLSTLQKSLDTTATDIVSSQKDNLIERKELAQKTKEYRKLGEEVKKEEWKVLLKCRLSLCSVEKLGTEF